MLTLVSSTIVGLTPYVSDKYPADTWRDRMHLQVIDGQETVVIPAVAIKAAMIRAAKGYRPGPLGRTFASNLWIDDDLPLGIAPEMARTLELYLPHETRRYPQIKQWEETFVAYIQGPAITRTIFCDVLTLAGLEIGVGRFRPQHGGRNGSFRVAAIDWQEQADAA